MTLWSANMTIHHPPQDIHLEPADWHIALWRNLPPLPMPPLAPFDKADGLKRLKRITVTKGGVWNWSAVQLPTHMNAKEAAFWLTALFAAQNAKTPAQCSELTDTAKPPPRKELVRRLLILRQGNLWQLSAILFAYLGPRDFLEVLRNAIKSRTNEVDSLDYNFLSGFRQEVFPYLSTEQRQEMRNHLGQIIAEYGNQQKKVPILFASIAALLGMSDAVENLLENAPSKLTVHSGERCWMLFFGLDTVEKIKTRLHEALNGVWIYRLSPEFVRAVVASLEEDAIPLLAQQLNGCPRESIELFIQEIGRIRRASTARPMLELRLKNRGPIAAQRWLEENPELAVTGLLPLVREEPLQEAIVELLRGFLRSSDKRKIVEHHLNALPAQQAQWLRKALDTTLAQLQSPISDQAASVPSWFVFDGRTDFKLPKWLDLATLPAIFVEGQPLPAQCVPVILADLRDSTLTEPGSRILQLKKHANAHSLDAFVLAVFERWLATSGSPKDWWTMTALGLLGSDRSSLRLGELILLWPQECFLQRALYGIQCLRACGNAQALASLRAIPFRQGRDTLKQIAQERGFSLVELADVAIPTLGLDTEFVLSFGPRQFRLGLSPSLEPCLIDSRYERRSTLPDMETTDDPSKVELARGEWESFRVRAVNIVAQQRRRLEIASSNQTTWDGAFFLRQMIPHPVLNPLLRSIVWGLFKENKLLMAFRVTLSNAVDITGSPVPLQAGQTVGIVHPTEMSKEERLIWGDVLFEQDTPPVFAQLAREPHVLPADQKDHLELLDWQDHKLPVRRLYAACQTRGWVREVGQQQAIYKAFPRSLQFACIEYRSDHTLNHLPSTTQKVTRLRCYFVKSASKRMTKVPNANYVIRLGEAHPMVYDEMMRVLLDRLPELPLKG
jgi:hypothetical protein